MSALSFVVPVPVFFHTSSDDSGPERIGSDYLEAWTDRLDAGRPLAVLMVDVRSKESGGEKDGGGGGGRDAAVKGLGGYPSTKRTLLVLLLLLPSPSPFAS